MFHSILSKYLFNILTIYLFLLFENFIYQNRKDSLWIRKDYKKKLFYIVIIKKMFSNFYEFNDLFFFLIKYLHKLTSLLSDIYAAFYCT